MWHHLNRNIGIVFPNFKLLSYPDSCFDTSSWQQPGNLPDSTVWCRVFPFRFTEPAPLESTELQLFISLHGAASESIEWMLPYNWEVSVAKLWL